MQREPDSSGVRLSWVLAPNAGPRTLDGTRTYIFTAERTVWIVDPGPAARAHAQAVVDAVVATGARRVGGIVVTHHHEGHTGATSMVRRALSSATGITVPLWAAEPALVPGAAPVPSEISIDGRVVADVLHLPGHTADSIGLLLEGGEFLTGDTLLGGEPSVVGEDCTLHEYLQCLNIIRVMCMDGRISGLYPGHGDPIEAPHEALVASQEALAYWRERLERVRQVRERGVLTVRRICDEIDGGELAALKDDGASADDVAFYREGAERNIRAALEYITGTDR